MIIRLRSRDGLERIEVSDAATVGGLKEAINTQMNIPLEVRVQGSSRLHGGSQTPQGHAFSCSSHGELTLNDAKVLLLPARCVLRPVSVDAVNSLGHPHSSPESHLQTFTPPWACRIMHTPGVQDHVHPGDAA